MPSLILLFTCNSPQKTPTVISGFKKINLQLNSTFVAFRDLPRDTVRSKKAGTKISCKETFKTRQKKFF